jgi:hypothetical protein
MTRCFNQISNPITGKCISCEDKHFANTRTNYCTACPLLREKSDALALGVECRSGFARIKDDYYVVPDDRAFGPHTATLRCLDHGVCTTVVDKSTFIARTVCQRNTTGLLCGLCAEGFGKAAGQCVECPSAAAQAAVTWVFGLLALGISVLMTRKSLNPDFKGATVTVIRIAVSFLMATGFLSQLQLDWGSVLRQIFSLAKASSGGVPPFIDCAGVSFEAEMAASLMLPLLVPVVPSLMIGVWSLVQRARDLPASEIMGVDRRYFFINSCVATSYLLWPALVVQCLRIFNCSVAVGERRFVASALDVQCDVRSHATLKALAAVELVVIVPALPALLLYRLRKYDTGKGSWNRKHLFFLFGGFREGFEYWEAVVLARKFLILAIGVFLADNTFGLQVAAAMWVMTASTMLQLMCKPYQHATEERLETLSLGGTTVAMMIGQVILGADGADGLGSAGLAACQGTVIAILLFTACCFVVFFVREVLAARRAKQNECGTAENGDVEQDAHEKSTGAGKPRTLSEAENWDPFGGAKAIESTFSVTNPMTLHAAEMSAAHVHTKQIYEVALPAAPAGSGVAAGPTERL